MKLIKARIDKKKWKRDNTKDILSPRDAKRKPYKLLSVERIKSTEQWPFDPANTQQIKEYLRTNWGEGWYRVYDYGGQPLLQDYFKGFVYMREG